MSKPRLLDLYCKAGGATRGYQMAGFHVTGVDIEPQSNYIGDAFIQSDAIDYVSQHGWQFDAIHASPPCEGFSKLTLKKFRNNHLNMIPITRYWLQSIGLPYVIENVEGARYELRNPFMLCGSMFQLRIFRHRYFETNLPIDAFVFATSPCCHDFKPIPVNSSSAQRTANAAECSEGLHMFWGTRDEKRKAIPPAYTNFIGRRLMNYILVKQNMESTGINLLELAVR